MVANPFQIQPFMNAKILIVDDEIVIRELLSSIMGQAGYETEEVESGQNLKERFRGPAPDLVLLDLKLGDGEGLDILPDLKKEWPDTEVIVLTGYASLDAAVLATKLGAYDFQKKPFDQKTLLLSVERALEHRGLRRQTSSLRQALSTMSGEGNPIFASVQMKEVLRTLEKVAASDVPILVTGESGTGKEVIADLVHSMSMHSNGPLVKINCAALPRELIESELFGSVKGAFTGAQSDREGLFRQAKDGTLMLDEISEMPIDTQSKLLRVLQEREVRPVGGRSTYKVNCRIVAATNRDAMKAIQEGKLREDLYYRISAITVALPPLRERKADILPLARSFLKRYAAQAGRNTRGFSEAAESRLMTFDWPGNVRQLQNEVQRALLLSDGDEVDVRDLAIQESAVRGEADDYTLMQGVERNTIIQMLKETGGNKLQAAKRLGIGRQTLYNKIKSYEIDL